MVHAVHARSRKGTHMLTCMYLGRVDLCKKYCCCFLSGYPRYFCCFFRLPGCTHTTHRVNTLAHSFSSDEDIPIPSFELLSFLYITHTREEYCGTTYSYLCVLVCMYDVPYYLFTFKPCTHAWYPVAGRRYCTFTLRDDVDTTYFNT